jgi:uncharacterized protein YuzE
MGAKLTFRYDQVGDTLYIDKVPPYPEQESEELDDEIVVRMHPDTGEVENLEILFYAARLKRGVVLELPVEASLRLAT